MWSQQSPPGVGAPPEQRQRTAFYVALAGVVLSVVGIMLAFVKGTNSYTGLSETVKGTDEFGVGWWPVLYTVIAAAALYAVQRRPDLSATALGGVACGLGLLDLIYVFYRHSDVQDEVDKRTGGIVKIDTEMGFYVLMLGAALALAGATWFTVLARGGMRRVPRGMVNQQYSAGYYQAQAQPPMPQGYPPQQPYPPQQAYPPQAGQGVPPPPTAARPPQQPNAVYPGQTPPPPQ